MKIETVCPDCKINHIKELNIDQYHYFKEEQRERSILCHSCYLKMVEAWIQDRPNPVKDGDEKIRFKNLYELGSHGILRNPVNQI